MFLVPIYRDLRIQQIVKRPVTICFLDDEDRISDVELVEKTGILCDACSSRVAVTEEELETLPTGYALCDGEQIYEVVCEDCRRRYYARLRVYDDLDKALEGG
jgi:hypothetical protein